MQWSQNLNKIIHSLHFACKSTEQGQIEPDQLTSITLKVKRINA